MKTVVRVVILLVCGAFGSLAVRGQDLPSFVFKVQRLAETSDPAVHELIEKAAGLVHPRPREGRALIVEAFRKVDQGAAIDDYDFLYGCYGLLKSSHETNTSTFGPGTRADYIKVAQKVLAFLDREGQVGQWVFTPQGQLRIEVYVVASNGLAWLLLEDAGKDPKRLAAAYEVIERGVAHVRGPEDYYALDTQVRILLAMGRKDEAYEIVAAVLAEDESFRDFQDLAASADYRAWIAKKKTKTKPR